MAQEMNPQWLVGRLRQALAAEGRHAWPPADPDRFTARAMEAMPASVVLDHQQMAAAMARADSIEQLATSLWVLVGQLDAPVYECDREPPDLNTDYNDGWCTYCPGKIVRTLTG